MTAFDEMTDYTPDQWLAWIRARRAGLARDMAEAEFWNEHIRRPDQPPQDMGIFLEAESHIDSIAAGVALAMKHGVCLKTHFKKPPQDT